MTTASASGRTIKVAVNGCCGRMGRRIVQLVSQEPGVELCAAVEAAGHAAIGQDIGPLCGLPALGVTVQPELTGHPDVAIDFSSPDGTMAIAGVCRDRGIPLVVATTGLTDEQRTRLEGAARCIPLAMAPNMSLCVNLLMKLVGQAAAVLKDADADVEIIERHHRFKKDAPSGTALEFARIIAAAAGPKRLVHGREGLVGCRPRDEIGIHAVRVGDNVGEHSIIFSLLGETIELVHRAHSRDCYARGAIEAARFLIGRQPGLYTMAHVLGL